MIKPEYKTVLVYQFFHDYQGDLLDAGKFYVRDLDHLRELFGVDSMGDWGFDYISYLEVKPRDWNEYSTFVPDGF